MGKGAQVVEKLTWISTPDDLLEDGLLMLGLHVATHPVLRQRADQHFNTAWYGQVDLRRDIIPERLHELYACNRQQDWPQHVAITVMFGSTILGQLGVLRQYRFGMELCTWQQCRYKLPDGVKVLFCDPIPSDPIGDDDDTSRSELPF